METRRIEVGRKIKSLRRHAGFRSQRAFADAIGTSESSIANAERGSDRIGDGVVYELIEGQFHWPVGSITAYIAGTGPEPWSASVEPSPPAATEPEDGWTPEDVERVRGMSAEEIVAEARMIGKFSKEGEVAQLRYLRKAADIKLQKPVTPSS